MSTNYDTANYYNLDTVNAPVVRPLPQAKAAMYTSSLPKGRPSMYSYGSADDSTGPKNADLTDPHPPVPVDDSSPVSALIEDTSLDLPTDLWPWTQPFNWDDTSMEWSDQGSGQLILNQHAMIDTAQTDDKMACITAVPNLLDRTAAVQDGDRDDYAQRQPGPTTPTQSLSQFFGHGHGHSHGTGHIGGSSGTSFGGGSDNNDGLDVVIAELAHLSVHLSPLRRSSYSLAGTLESSYHQNQARQKPLIDDATFESVAGWLAHGHGSAHNTTNMSSSPAANGHNPPFSPLPAPETKTTSAMLYHTFSASRHLLEILRYLQPNGGVSGTSTLSKPTRSTTPSTSASSSDALYFKLPKSSACNNIIHHQVIACHMILLNIYVAVLAVLERDTDPRAHRDNAAPLGDIRLVSVVQLCSYLIKRQHRAMDLYLGGPGSLYAAFAAPMSSQDLDLSGLLNRAAGNSLLQHSDSRVTLDTATSEAMKNLKMELQERLERLQQTLCI